MTKPKSQIEKFREAARAIEADEDEGKFNDALWTLAKPSPQNDAQTKRMLP